MEYIRVRNRGPLEGRVTISGAKNAALPILAASLLGTEEIVLEQVPPLKDVEVMVEVLRALDVKVDYLDAETIRIDASQVTKTVTPGELMNRMRASFVVMGPLLTRLGRTFTQMPGGCNIGKRPVDLHLKGFKALGAEIDEEPDAVGAKAPDGGLVGGKVYLDFPSVGATQNIMMAATLARGESIIENAAKEPEITDLANFLNKMGAKVRGAGTSTITIEGVEKLHGARHIIIPDRIEASTFIVAAAMTGGTVEVQNVLSDHIRPILAKIQEVGVRIEETDDDSILVQSTGRLKATKIRTLPYPGFPTDVQAQFMALMCIAKGQSYVEETVFENRFMHVDELNKMGALIVTDGNEAVIRGVEHLVGAKVNATDLRAGAALVLAGLVADGETQVHNVYHLDRGYYRFEEKLKGLGADVERFIE
ncbi:UDP-N-acetylglucosamine 1-carboxyvinyltransferase [Murdochiella massiliensis]|uniref:UDP-N-acetylglucosamine 1-carboxyvinyltransferase n=1 Tax=Murdochiella massiliensis TaxID=1673723 RepID=UPI0008345565|nr:UDP-N-acetylglucosamine 1-carboxyvinyltransferase [Murdochiella massiliensis]